MVLVMLSVLNMVNFKLHSFFNQLKKKNVKILCVFVFSHTALSASLRPHVLFDRLSQTGASQLQHTISKSQG